MFGKQSSFVCDLVDVIAEGAASIVAEFMLDPAHGDLDALGEPDRWFDPFVPNDCDRPNNRGNPDKKFTELFESHKSPSRAILTASRT